MEVQRPVIVIKVGTSSLIDTNAGGRVQVASIARVAEVSDQLIRSGYAIIIVSSGAVGLGCSRLQLAEKPAHIAGKQAAAAVGQLKLMSLYDNVFGVLGHSVAQVLLTYDTFGDRGQYLNARATFLELLKMRAIPIVNENDTVAVQELRVGDNDTLSALVASMVNAQWLFLMTDVDALYEANPRVVPGAKPISIVRSLPEIQNLRRQMIANCKRLDPSITLEEMQASENITKDSTAAESLLTSGTHEDKRQSECSVSKPCAPQQCQNKQHGKSKGGKPGLQSGTIASSTPTGGAGTAWGTGGMVTKLKAAQIGTAAGTRVVIFNTAQIHLLSDVLSGYADAPHIITPSAGSSTCSSLVFAERAVGTTFLPAAKPLSGRKRWILSLLPEGTLVLDPGASTAVTQFRKSLFPAGIREVIGDFEPQDAVSLVDEHGRELARCLVNYGSQECMKLQGRQSSEVSDILGFAGSETVADRDNIVVLERAALTTRTDA